MNYVNIICIYQIVQKKRKNWNAIIKDFVKSFKMQVIIKKVQTQKYIHGMYNINKLLKLFNNDKQFPQNFTQKEVLKNVT